MTKAEYLERDLRLFTDWKAGFKMSVLVARYKISRQRVYQILAKFKELAK